MTYGPPVIKQCEYCKKEYKCPNSRTSKSRFCTITCRNKSGLLPRVEYKCVNCNDKFMARPDHGADRRFCSRKCFLEDCVQPIDKECGNCGGMFTAGRSSTVTRGDGRRLYCSNKCRVEDSRSFEEKPCIYCGAMFYPRSTKHDATQRTCSTKCKAEFFSGANAHNFQGGVHVQKTTNHKFVLIGRREGYVGKYTAQHRLVCAKQIGRMLKRSEIVVHINNDGLDNRPSNLFLCESMSEFARRRNGSLPWPKKSNLKEYKERFNK
jgi:ribosomal protein L24E